MDLRTLWDFSDPEGSEQRFRQALTTSNDPEERDLIATQVARALGLQRRFDEGFAQLDALVVDAPEVRVRRALERGRLHRSGGAPERARPFFIEAWESARRDDGLDALAVDAAHMLALVAEGEEALAWNARALALAEASSEPAARRWLGSLYNNIGWTRFEMGEHAAALELFERALVWRIEQGVDEPIWIARWCVARCLRALNRGDEALTIQRELESLRATREAESGFVFEELAELSLDKHPDEARLYFSRAHALLSQDVWLREAEPERLARLLRLSMPPTTTTPEHTRGPMIYRTVQQMTQMLRNLSSILDKGLAFAEASETTDAAALIRGQLAPDMFNFIRQVQTTTDTAKFTAARLSGKTAPSWDDDEESIEELKARLDKAIAYLEGFKEADFEGGAEREIALPFMPGMGSRGVDYLFQFSVPNFYFHMVTAYNILRHVGVDIGKRDYIGHIDFKPLAGGA